MTLHPYEVGHLATVKALAASSRDGVILLQEDLRIAVVNRAALHYLGLQGDPNGWLERSLWDVVRGLRNHAPEAADQVLEECRRLEDGNVESGEGEYKINFRTIRWTNLPLARDRQTVAYIVLLRDVTEVELLRDLRKDLMHILIREIHDPLNEVSASLKSFLDARGNQLEDEHGQLLRAAIGRADEMCSACAEFVDVAQLRSGQMPLSVMPFSFAELVDRVLRTQELSAEARELRLERHIAPELPPAWGDPPLLERAFRGLLSNTLRLAKPGDTVVVAVDLEEEKLRVRVQDRRSGGARGAERCREPAPTWTSRVEDGPALTLCRAVLAAHGEQIRVTGSARSGATVTFTLPLVSESFRGLYPTDVMPSPAAP
ncbi:MAG: ATP-binding protein [Anaerolineae bacterium]